MSIAIKQKLNLLENINANGSFNLYGNIIAVRMPQEYALTNLLSHRTTLLDCDELYKIKNKPKRAIMVKGGNYYLYNFKENSHKKLDNVPLEKEENPTFYLKNNSLIPYDYFEKYYISPSYDKINLLIKKKSDYIFHRELVSGLGFETHTNHKYKKLYLFKENHFSIFDKVLNRKCYDIKAKYFIFDDQKGYIYFNRSDSYYKLNICTGKIDIMPIASNYNLMGVWKHGLIIYDKSDFLFKKLYVNI